MTDPFAIVPALIQRNDARGCWDLFVACPLCGDQHRHGGGTTDGAPLLGHRVSHCLYGKRIGYLLTEGPADMAIPRKLTGTERKARGSI